MSDVLIKKCAETAARLYRANKSELIMKGKWDSKKRPDFKIFLRKALVHHNYKVADLGQDGYKKCQQEMGKILGARGGAKTAKLRRAGLIPTPPSPAPDTPPRLHFSTFLFQGMTQRVS